MAAAAAPTRARRLLTPRGSRLWRRCRTRRRRASRWTTGAEPPAWPSSGLGAAVTAVPSQGRAPGAGGGCGRLEVPPHRATGRRAGSAHRCTGAAPPAPPAEGTGLAAEPVPWPRARHRHLRKPRVSPAAPRSEEARRQKRSLPLPPPPIVHRRTEGTEPTALPSPPPPSLGTGNHRRPCRRGQHRGSYPARRAPAPLLPEPRETAGSAGSGRGRVWPARHGCQSWKRAALPALLCMENVPAGVAASPLPHGAEPG